MRFLDKINKKERLNFNVPRCVQDCIPVQRIYKDGIFYLERNEYSMSYKFSDINFAVSNKDDKEGIFLKYCELLNSFDSSALSQITLINRKLSRSDFERLKLNNKCSDELEKHRIAYNNILLDKALYSNRMMQDKYITVAVEKKSVEDARVYYTRTSIELASHLSGLNSQLEEQDCNKRLKILYDFYRGYKDENFFFDINDSIRKGHDFKDYICPDGAEIKNSYIKFGDKYVRVLFIREYANFIKDSFITELTDLNKNMMLTISALSVPMDEAVREAENRRLGVETNIANFQRRQNANLNFSSDLTYDLQQQRIESKEFLDDLVTRDQRMFLCTITIVHTADSLEELNNDTETINTIGQRNMCQIGTLRYQQLEALNTTLPIGLRKTQSLRTLTTESLGAFVPFKVQEINDENGIYYGQNVISKNMIIADRKKLINGNSFILGVSGSGKSFTAKQEIVSTLLREPDADVIVIDPEREYRALTQAFGGEVIDISAISDSHINAMDLNSEYGEDGRSPIILKSEFIMSLCELSVGKSLDTSHLAIIDRCATNVYRTYIQNNYQGEVPTLKTFRNELLKQPEHEAKEIALALELFTEGSLNTFAKQTNVDVNNRFVCYDILELGTQLKSIGMLVVLDNVLNRITNNRRKGRTTYVFIDEIYLLFKSGYSSGFLSTLWKRVRKYGGLCTGITQNIAEIMKNDAAQSMFSNSEFIIMLNQSSSDREVIKKEFNLTDQELSYITNVRSGQGLIKINNNLIPFINEFPKDTELYRLMSTKPKEFAS